MRQKIISRARLPEAGIRTDNKLKLNHASESDEKDFGDLNRDLQKAPCANFVFPRTYFFHLGVDASPYPGLTIDGVGLISLPLTNELATKIISQVATASDNSAQPTTWELNPGEVSLANPAWATFVATIVAEKVWGGLAIESSPENPRCELNKVVLYETGSHVTPRKDLPTVKGTFASVLIVLPSACEGGEVHLMHNGRSNIVNVSKDCLFNTSFIAWYTPEVTYEVKPLTSGYRLALWYSIIHTSPTSPQPYLPSGPYQALDQLRSTLNKWRDTDYRPVPKRPIVAFMLAKKYPLKALNRGAAILKGTDRHLVRHVLPVLEEMGYCMCLARLERSVTGSAEGYDPPKWGEGDYDDYDEDYYNGEVPDMDEDDEIEETLMLSNLVRISTSAAGSVDLGLRAFELDAGALVSGDGFKDTTPDKKSCDEGSVSHRYLRSALVMFPIEHQMSIIASINGPEAALPQLPLTDNPTPDTQSVVEDVLQNLENNPKSPSTVNANLILHHAIAWKRGDLWNKAVLFVKDLKIIEGVIADSLKVFEIELIKPGFCGLIQQTSGLQNKLNIIDAAAAHLESTAPTWVRSLYVDVLTSYSEASVEDVPALLRLAQKLDEGITIIASKVIPETKTKANAYDFHTSLAEALNQLRQQLKITDLNDAVDGRQATFKAAVRESLLAATTQWLAPPTPPVGNSGLNRATALSQVVLMERARNLVRLCFAVDADLCTQVFASTQGSHKMEVVYALMHYMWVHREDDDPVQDTPWLDDLMKTSLQSYSTPDVCHAQVFSWIANSIGPEYVSRWVNRTAPKSGIFEFLLALAQSLRDLLPDIREGDKTGEDTRIVQETIVRCILSAIEQWQTGSNVTLDRVIALVEICFTIKNLKPCTTLFDKLLQIPSSRVKNVHIPLVPLLKGTINKHGKKITDDPFKAYFAGVISLYLAHILGSTPSVKEVALPRRVLGCRGPCTHCGALKTWIHTSNPLLEFPSTNVDERKHLKEVISFAGFDDLLSCETTRTIHWLCISKKPAFLAHLKWKEAQSAARQFLKSIGDENVLQSLMGARYGDMESALHGAKTFAITQLATNDPGSSSGHSASNGLPRSSLKRKYGR